MRGRAAQQGHNSSTKSGGGERSGKGEGGGHGRNGDRDQRDIMDASLVENVSMWEWVPDDGSAAMGASMNGIKMVWDEHAVIGDQAPEERRLGRTGVMVATTMVRILNKELPKGIHVHGSAGTAKTSQTLHVIEQLLAVNGYESNRLAAITPLNAAAHSQRLCPWQP